MAGLSCQPLLSQRAIVSCQCGGDCPQPEEGPCPRRTQPAAGLERKTRWDCLFLLFLSFLHSVPLTGKLCNISFTGQVTSFSVPSEPHMQSVDLAETPPGLALPRPRACRAVPAKAQLTSIPSLPGRRALRPVGEQPQRTCERVGWLPIKHYLHGRATGQVWATGLGLPTLVRGIGSYRSPLFLPTASPQPLCSDSCQGWGRTCLSWRNVFWSSWCQLTLGCLTSGLRRLRGPRDRAPDHCWSPGSMPAGRP